MTLEEIIKKQKEHLTKAQIRALAEKAERYKQVTASQRAEAFNSLHKGLTATRRGLQNMGLAGRNGKIVSGAQKQAGIDAQNAYGQYAAGLRGVSDTYTQNAAARMSNVNAREKYLADLKKQQEEIDKEAAEIKKKYEQMLAAQHAVELENQAAETQADQQMMEWNNLMTDPRLQQQSGVERRNAADARRRLFGNAMSELTDPRIGGIAPDRRQAIELRRQAIEAAYKDYMRTELPNFTDPRLDNPQKGNIAYAVMENEYHQKLPEWQKAIANEPQGEISPRDSVAKGNKKKAEQARQDMAETQAIIARYSLRSQLPEGVGNLVILSDDDFDVRYDAAERAYKRAIQEAKIARQDNSSTMDDLDPNGIERKATEEFVKWEAAKRYRDKYSAQAYYYDSINPTKAANRYKGNPTEGHYTDPRNHSYDNAHGTEGSAYAAIVNELSGELTYKDRAYRYTFRGKMDFSNKEYAEFLSRVAAAYGDKIAPNAETTNARYDRVQAAMIAASYMSQGEKDKYNTILANYGVQKADEYFEYLYNNVLVDRVSQAIEEDYDATLRRTTKYDENGNRIGAEDGKLTWLAQATTSALSVPVNLIEGAVEPISTLLNNQTDPVAARMEAIRGSSAQGMRNAVQENFGGFGRFVYGTGMSMLDSAASAAISSGIGKALSGMGVSAKLAEKAGSLIGGSLLGGSAFNSAYQEALDKGLSPENARLTAVGQGINEMLFETLSLDMLVSQFQHGGMLKPFQKAWKNWVVNTLVQGGVEGSEEVFTDIANKVYDNAINGIMSDELTAIRKYMSEGMSFDEAKKKVSAEYAGQLGMSFLGGFISGGVMGGGATFLGMLQGQDVAKIGRNLDDAAKAEIRAYDFQNAEAKEILSGKLTEEDYGRLAMTRLEEMAQTDPIAAEKAAQALIDATARTDLKVDKRNQTLKTGTENSVSFNYDGVTDVKQMSGVQVEALRFAQTLVKSKVGGVNINVANQLFDKNGNEQNGWYDPKTNTVHVSLNGSQSVVYTISHELTHRLKSGNEEAYASMRDAMKSELESLDLTGSDLPGEYENILGDYLVKDGEQRSAWEALIEYEMDRYAKHGITLDRESAEEEVVCRACETMLERSRLISSMISKNVRSAKTIAKFLASIYDDIASLKEEAESRGYVDGSPEKLFIDQYTDVEKIATAWANAMKTVNEKEGKRKPKTERISKSKNGDYARLSKSETAKASGNIDVTADVVAEGENGKPLSIKSLDFDMRSGKMYKDLVEHGVMTEEEVVKFDRFLNDLVAYIKPNRAFLDMNESYDRDNRPFTAFKDNSDPLYKLSLDFSTLCRKRLTTQYIIEKLQMKLKKALSAEEQLAVRAMLKDYQKIDKGLQVACGMCYVEAARYKSPKQINLWLTEDGRRKAMIQYFAIGDKEFAASVKQKQAEWKVRHGYADNATKDAMSSADVNAFNKMSYGLRQAYEMDEEHQAILDKALAMPEEQFLSAANLADLAEGDEAEQTIYAAYTRFIRAATRSKSLEADIPYYYGDSDSRVSDTFIKNVNAENGMRFDSWSDFQFTHLLDMIIAITDLSVRGSAMHGYTKFPEMVRIFGKTGAMFNLSGVPQGIGLKEDGSLDFSPTESINADEAMKLREEFPETAGFQCIGINNNHINALLNSDFIDYVIPYHVSGMNAKLRSIAKIAGWQDYTGTQNAKIDKSLDGNKANCDPSVWHVEPVFSEFFVGYNTGMSGIDAMRASAERYVDMCHERGMKPKFEQFLDNDNYWKLLIDRKMIDQKTGALIEQKAVKPNFDLNTIKREIDKYVNSYDQNREENAFNYIVDRWDEVPALVAKLEKEGRAEKKRQQEAAKNIDMLKGEMVNAVPGRIPAKAAAQKFSINESDSQYMDLARRYESGDKSVEAELRKAVDAAAKSAGYPIHAYRGGGNVHNVFDTNRGAGTTQYGRGTYFTDAKGLAKEWAAERAGEPDKGYVGEYYVGIKKMFDDTSTIEPTQEWKNVERILKGYGVDSARIKHAQNYGFEGIAKALQSVGIISKGAFDAYSWKNAEKVNKILREAGYDGIKGEFYDSYQYVIFNPAQAKSADLITKDDNGNIIPLSERFNTKNEDIRYSLKDTVEGESLGKEYLKYLQLGAKVVNQTATEAEIKEFKQRMVQLSEDNRMAFLDKLREKLIRADEAAKVREVRDRQIARLKEEFRESKEKARERRIRSDLTNTLKKGNDRIVQLLARPTENAHVPVQLAQAVAEYAQRLNQLLTTSEPKTGEFAGMEKQTQKGALNAQKILDAYRRSFADEETIAQAKAENPKYDPRGLLPTSEYDEQLVKMIEAMDSVIQGKRMSDLTTDELRLVMNTMRGVIHAVTDANKLIGTNENKTIWKAGDSMIHQFEDAPDVKLKGYLETSLDLRRLARIFSGSNDNAEFVKLVERLNDGAIEKERIAQVLQDIFAPVTEKYGDEIRKWYGKKAEWIDTGITQNGKKVEITKGMRVSLAMHVLNAGNMNHIANGGITIPNRDMYNKGRMTDAYANGETVQLSAEQIEEIISHMTDAEKAYVEAAKEFFHKRTGYYVNKTSLQLLGYRKATVENYFPIHTDKNFTKTDFASLQMDGSIEGQGFLKERVNASNPVYLEDITSVVNRQIRGVALYAGLAVPMRNFNAVMNSTEYFEDENGAWRPRTTVRKAMTQKMGEYGAKVVKGFLEDASEMTHVDVSPMERFAGKLATNYVKAVLLGNLKVAMKQVASYPTAAAVIPWKYLGKALLNGGRNGRVISRADVDLINQYTPLYQMRREGNANEIASIMAKRGMEQKLPWLLGWITKMDVMTVGRLWSAAEYMVADQQNLPVGSDEYYKAVAKVFNDTIQQTQPNFTPLQRNAALRSKNPVVRSLVLFGTQRMQNGGILIEAAMDLKHSKGKSKAEIKAAKMKLGRAVASQIVQNILLIVASLGVDALRGRMKGWQDDDKEITPESMAKNMGDMFLSNFIGSFLVGSETYSLFSGLFKKAMGETTYDTEFTVPALDAVETLINFAQSDVPDAVKYLLGDHTDEEKQKKAINFSYQLAKAFGYATGIPLENALKDVFKGIIPAIEDISDAIKTGELNPWLHQSGKLDKKTTNANYKEWTNLGKKGSVYLYWERVANDLPKEKDSGYPKSDMLSSKLMADRDLTPEEKTTLYRMLGGDLVQEGAVVYHPLTVNQKYLKDKEHGTIAVDFTNYSRYQMSQMGDAKYNGFLKAVEMGVPEDLAVTAYRNYASAKKNETRLGVDAKDSFHDWLFKMVSDPAQRAILDMQVVGKAKRVEGTIGYKENGEVYADYSSKEMFDLYTNGKKQDKSDAIISMTDTPEAKAQAFANTDNSYHAKGGIVYNDKDKVIADFTSDEAYRASQMGESHYEKYNDAVKYGMSKENAILAVEKHKEFTDDDDKDNATQYATWVFNTYKNAKDRAIAGAIYTTKPVTAKDGRTYDENGYIYRDYTSAAWYKLSNRTLSKDGVNKRYEAAKLLEKDGYSAEKTVAAYVELDKLSKKTEWQKWLKDNGYTNDQIKIFLWSRGWAKLK